MIDTRHSGRLHSRSPDSPIRILARRGEHRFRLQLGAFSRVLQALDNPQHQFDAVLVGGTNGKGSVSAMLDSMLRSAGRHSGLYTSPHLISVTERIKLNGVAVTEQRFEELLDAVLAAEARCGNRAKLTYFELLTGAAFLEFAEQAVDLAVLEVGLGGRLDATNVCRPSVTVLTSIGLDHTAILGTSLDEIAREKAGILRSNVPLVSGIESELFERVIVPICEEKQLPYRQLRRHFDATVVGSQLRFHNGQTQLLCSGPPLSGCHQLSNAALAVESACLLGLDEHSIIEGLRRTRWPGRVQWIPGRPTKVLDVAHNPDSARALVRTIAAEFERFSGLVCLLATQSGKDWQGMLAAFDALNPRFVITRIDHPGALEPRLVAGWLEKRGAEVVIEPEPGLALELALRITANDELLAIFGSHYLLGPLMRHSALAGESQ